MTLDGMDALCVRSKGVYLDDEGQNRISRWDWKAGKECIGA